MEVRKGRRTMSEFSKKGEKLPQGADTAGPEGKSKGVKWG